MPSAFSKLKAALPLVTISRLKESQITNKELEGFFIKNRNSK